MKRFFDSLAVLGLFILTIGIVESLITVPEESRAQSAALAAADWDFAERMLDAAYVDMPNLVQLPGAVVATVTYNLTASEGAADQHIGIIRSTDNGHTWSAPVDIEAAADPESSWAVPWYDSATGVLYVFYIYNVENVRSIPRNDGLGSTNRVDSIGAIAYRTSSDGGLTWGPRSVLSLPPYAIDQRNPFGGSKQLLWLFGSAVHRNGKLYIGFSKMGVHGVHGLFGDTEAFLLRLDTGTSGVSNPVVLPGAVGNAAVPAQGSVTKVDTATSPDRVSISWTGQSNPSNKVIGQKERVEINGATYFTTSRTTVGNVYLPAGTAVAVGDAISVFLSDGADGYVTNVDTTTYPTKISVSWTNQSNSLYKDIATGDPVVIGTRAYTTIGKTGVGNIYLPIGTPIALYEGVYMDATTTPTVNTGTDGIKAPVPFWNPSVTPKIAEEPSVLVDADGTIHVALRTNQGRLLEAWSTDGGASFSVDWARQSDGYLTVYHPRGPATMFELPDGRIVLWTYNNSASDFGSRNTVWYRMGTRFGSRIRWDAPRALLFDSDVTARIGYPSFLVVGSELLIAAADKTSARIIRVPLSSL